MPCLMQLCSIVVTVWTLAWADTMQSGKVDEASAFAAAKDGSIAEKDLKEMASIMRDVKSSSDGYADEEVEEESVGTAGTVGTAGKGFLGKGNVEIHSEDLRNVMTAEQMRTLHKKIDTDGNGKVSILEITNFAEKMRRAIAKRELDTIIAAMDADKDGKLSLAEFLGSRVSGPDAAEAREAKTRDFQSVDADSDGLVDADELPALFHHYTNEKVENMLTTVAMKDKDLDNDGSLSIEEFYDNTRSEPGAALHLSPSERVTFKKLDKDGNGKLTQEELRPWESGSFSTAEAMKQLIKGADVDGDQQITADELVRARYKLAHVVSDAQMYLEDWKDFNFGPNQNEL
jgi:Ca2+-binding EF-hand superfamily protein